MVMEHLKTFDGLSAAFGWTGDEHEFVALATKSGAVVHASDFFLNMAFFSNLPNKVSDGQGQHAGSAEAAVEDKVEKDKATEEKAVHTVAFVMYAPCKRDTSGARYAHVCSRAHEHA